jgi:hypothetical protein
MGLEQLLQEPQLTEEQTALRSQFFSATGYGPSDLLSLNYSTHEFLTTNGGRYRLTGDGIQHLAGPPPALEERWDF